MVCKYEYVNTSSPIIGLATTRRLSQVQDFINTGKETVLILIVTTSTNEYAEQANNCNEELIGQNPNVHNQSIITTKNNCDDHLSANSSLADKCALRDIEEISEQTTYAKLIAFKLVLDTASEIINHPVSNITGELNV